MCCQRMLKFWACFYYTTVNSYCKEKYYVNKTRILMENKRFIEYNLIRNYKKKSGSADRATSGACKE